MKSSKKIPLVVRWGLLLLTTLPFGTTAFGQIYTHADAAGFVGASSASTAIAIDANYMFIGSDNDQRIRLYSRNQSDTSYINAFDFTSFLGVTARMDLEASTKTVVNGVTRIFWLGSHANDTSSPFNYRPNRHRLFATDVSGTGSNATLVAYGLHYDNLRSDLVAWDNLNASRLGLAASTNNVDPEGTSGSGFNIEGFAMAPDGVTAYIGFRAPYETPATRQNALIVPLLNLS